jgi:hypothetical protein
MFSAATTTVTIGGPAIKDRLFFFYSQEWNKEKRGLTRSSCVPTAEELSGDGRRCGCRSGR